MKHKIHIHNGYAEWEEAKEEGYKFTQLFGKYHHIFWSRKGKISLIRIKNYMKKGDDFWEIYCIRGKLFEDTERFDKRGDAMRRVEELLSVEQGEFLTKVNRALKLFIGIGTIAFVSVITVALSLKADNFLIKILWAILFWIVILTFMDWKDWVKK